MPKRWRRGAHIWKRFRILPNSDNFLPNSDEILPNSDEILPDSDEILPNSDFNLLDFSTFFQIRAPSSEGGEEPSEEVRTSSLGSSPPSDEGARIWKKVEKSNRLKSEFGRISSESGRISSEFGRISSEFGRKLSEFGRILNLFQMCAPLRHLFGTSSRIWNEVEKSNRFYLPTSCAASTGVHGRPWRRRMRSGGRIY